MLGGDTYTSIAWALPSHYAASGLGSFGFFSKTWILGSDSTKPLEVDSPILPLIAATHWG
jgi:hypothetical protein